MGARVVSVVVVVVASCGAPARPAAPAPPPPPAPRPASAPVEKPRPATPAVTGGEVEVGEHAPMIRALHFTDGGAGLVGGDRGQLVELDVATRRERGRIDLDSATAPNPHGRIGVGEKLRWSVGQADWAWDARAQELIGVVSLSAWGMALSGLALWRPASGVAPIAITAPIGVACAALAFSPDRARVALRVNARVDGACGHANAVQVYDLTTLQPVGAPIEVGFPLSAAFSSDGQLLAIGADRAHLHDLRSGTLETAPPSNRVTAIAIRPGSPRVLWRTDHGEIESWQPGERANRDHGHGPAFAFSPDGRRLAVARGQTVALYDATAFAPAGEPLTLRGSADVLAFSDDGRRLAAASSGAVWLWELEPGAAPANPSTWFALMRPLPVPPPRPMPPITRDGVLEGRVFLDGKPVAGAEIVLRPQPQEYPDAVKLPPITARSGRDGRFRITRLPTINWSIGVTARGALRGGHGASLRERKHSTADVNLRPAATIVGKVLGPDGRPARGVRLYHADDHLNREVELSARADGTFTIDHLQPGRAYRFTAARPDGAVRTATVELPELGLFRVTVVLAAPGDPTVLRGTVLDPAGAPLAGAQVIVNQGQIVKTDARGTFTVDVQGTKRPSVRVQGTTMGTTADVELPQKAPLVLHAKPY